MEEEEKEVGNKFRERKLRGGTNALELYKERIRTGYVCWLLIAGCWLLDWSRGGDARWGLRCRRVDG